ncbi:hypothetical protein BB560_000835, partial [Smittium megazygosporum]
KWRKSTNGQSPSNKNCASETPNLGRSQKNPNAVCNASSFFGSQAYMITWQRYKLLDCICQEIDYVPIDLSTAEALGLTQRMALECVCAAQFQLCKA